jgi:hypothetical protein
VDSLPESISDSEDWHNWSSDLDNPNDTKDYCVGADQSDIDKWNSIKVPECLLQGDVRATPNVFRLIQPTWKSNRQTEKVLVMFNEIKTRRNSGVEIKYNRIHQCFTDFFLCVDRDFYLEIDAGPMGAVACEYWLINR